MQRVVLEGHGRMRLVADAEGDEDASPVLLLHGGGQTRHAWGTTLHALAERGWHVYSVDLRGHGESDWSPDGEYGLDAFAADVLAIARSLPEPPVLVGASLGGLASLLAIADGGARPVASALVLVDVTPRIEADGATRIRAFMRRDLETGFADLEEAADAIAAYNPHRRRPRNLSGLRKNLRQRPDGRWTWHWDPAFMAAHPDRSDSRMTPDNFEQLRNAARSLTIPTLLVHGRMSDLVSDDGVRELQALVPHAQIVDVAEAGHMVAGDENDLFNDAVVAFLSEQRAAR